MPSWWPKLGSSSPEAARGAACHSGGSSGSCRAAAWPWPSPSSCAFLEEERERVSPGAAPALHKVTLQPHTTAAFPTGSPAPSQHLHKAAATPQAWGLARSHPSSLVHQAQEPKWHHRSWGTSRHTPGAPTAPTVPALLCPHPAHMHPSSWLVGDQFAPSMTVRPNQVTLPHWGGCAHTGTQQAVKRCLPSPWACTHLQDLWAPLYCSAHTQGGICSIGTLRLRGTSLAPVHVPLWFLALSFPRETICIQHRQKLLNRCMYRCTHTHTHRHAHLYKFRLTPRHYKAPNWDNLPYPHTQERKTPPRALAHGLCHSGRPVLPACLSSETCTTVTADLYPTSRQLLPYSQKHCESPRYLGLPGTPQTHRAVSLPIMLSVHSHATPAKTRFLSTSPTCIECSSPKGQVVTFHTIPFLNKNVLLQPQKTCSIQRQFIISSFLILLPHYESSPFPEIV